MMLYITSKCYFISQIREKETDISKDKRIDKKNKSIRTFVFYCFKIIVERYIVMSYKSLATYTYLSNTCYLYIDKVTIILYLDSCVKVDILYIYVIYIYALYTFPNEQQFKFIIKID